MTTQQKTTIQTLCYLFMILSTSFAFIGLPYLFWQVSLGDLLEITNNKDNIVNRFSELMERLNLTSESLYSWAKDKLAILACVAVILIAAIITLHYYTGKAINKPTKDEIKTDTLEK